MVKNLFKVYTYLNLLIQKHVFRKKIESIDFCASRVVIKRSSLKNHFNAECAQLACSYYRQKLHLDFSIFYKNGYYYTKAPFLRISNTKRYDFGKSDLARYILRNSRILTHLKYANKDCEFEVIWTDLCRHNCFLHNGTIYPLDLESFAFKVYKRIDKKKRIEIDKINSSYMYEPKRIILNGISCFVA